MRKSHMPRERLLFYFSEHIQARLLDPSPATFAEARNFAEMYVSQNETRLTANLENTSNCEVFMENEEPAFWDWIHSRCPGMVRCSIPTYWVRKPKDV